MSKITDREHRNAAEVTAELGAIFGGKPAPITDPFGMNELKWESAEAAEQRRRAELYPELVNGLREAARQIPEDGDFYQRSALRKARAILARCAEKEG